jgi:hypothetical protein
MQIVRVYTGADGESHFEDLTPGAICLDRQQCGGGIHHLELPSFPLLL